MRGCWEHWCRAPPLQCRSKIGGETARAQERNAHVAACAGAAHPTHPPCCRAHEGACWLRATRRAHVGDECPCVARFWLAGQPAAATTGAPEPCFPAHQAILDAASETLRRVSQWHDNAPRAEILEIEETATMVVRHGVVDTPLHGLFEVVRARASDREIGDLRWCDAIRWPGAVAVPVVARSVWLGPSRKGRRLELPLAPELPLRSRCCPGRLRAAAVQHVWAAGLRSGAAQRRCGAALRSGAEVGRPS